MILFIYFSNRDEIMYTKLYYTLSLLVLAALIMGCESDNSTLNEDKSKVSTIAGYRTINVGNLTREYILYIPSSYAKSKPTPLVINFHGFGDSAADYAKTIGKFYNFNSLADTSNFIVAYPQAVMREKEGVYWDPGDNGSENIYDNDVYFTELLITEISKDYNVDLSRVYAIGYSNGGMMAYGLACNSGDHIAAVGIMSGIMLKGSCDESARTSVIHFHGSQDDVLPLEGDDESQSVSDVIGFWLDHNNILPSSLVMTKLNNGDVLRYEYDSENKKSSVVLYVINREYNKPGGHVWFSGDIDGISPNQILWEFLSGFTLDN